MEFSSTGTDDQVKSVVSSHLIGTYSVEEDQLTVVVSDSSDSSARRLSVPSPWVVDFEVIAPEQAANEFFKTVESMSADLSGTALALQAAFASEGLEMDVDSLFVTEPEIGIFRDTIEAAISTGTTEASTAAPAEEATTAAPAEEATSTDLGTILESAWLATDQETSSAGVGPVMLGLVFLGGIAIWILTTLVIRKRQRRSRAAKGVFPDPASEGSPCPRQRGAACSGQPGAHGGDHDDDDEMALAGTGDRPSAGIERAIDEAFGSMDEFRARFEAASDWSTASVRLEVAPPGTGGEPSVGIEAVGSTDEFEASSWAAGARGARPCAGWVWLVVTADKKLAITSTSSQDNPLMDGVEGTLGTPVLACDVWEHTACHTNYQCQRRAYMKAWWDVVDWKAVGTFYEEALDGKVPATEGSPACRAAAECSPEPPPSNASLRLPALR
jgi:superoxide dismutase